MQERTASTALKCVVPKDKIRIKAPEVNGSGSRWASRKIKFVVRVLTWFN